MSARKIATDVIAAVGGTDRYGLVAAAAPAGAYPLDLGFTLFDEDRFYAPRDSEGIPLRRYASVGLQYNPTRIAGYALAHYNRYCESGDDASAGRLLACADWFSASRDGRWEYRFDWGGLRAPWISGMAQGQGISVLVRAHAMTGDSRYLEQARTAALPFARQLTEGGVRSQINGRWEFLEEYPLAAPAHTLNGFLFALVGIFDLEAVVAGAGERLGVAALVATLEQQWQLWDTGFWSAYDLHRVRGARNCATVNYHRIHITLLRYLAGVLSSAVLAKCATRWEQQYGRRRNRLRALACKGVYRLVVPAQR